MSKLLARVVGFFSNRSFVGADKTGNRYFARKEEVDGIIEWICWLNGQRKRAPTPEELIELEARRERVRLNVILLKKEEEERKAKEGKARKVMHTGKVGGPDLKSFIQQFPTTSEGDKPVEASEDMGGRRTSKEGPEIIRPQEESSEPTGTGQSFRPGTWQPPT